MKKVFILFAIILISLSYNLQAAKFRNAVFLHHSTGGCIWGPNGSNVSVPDEVAKYNTQNSLAGTNIIKFSEKGWPETPWDNEWYRWDNIFANSDKDADIQPIINAYDIIVIKSCYPSSAISGWGSAGDTLSPTKKTIYNYKWHWRNFINKMQTRPDKFFVIWTNAPLTESTSGKAGALSDAFCKWAKDTLAKGLDSEFPNFPKNVYIFDYFHILANANGLLPAELSASSGDSHPNAKATAIAAPLFVKQVFDNAINYENISSVNDALTNTFSIYPNPVKDRINISFNSEISGNLRATITNEIGENIYSIDINAIAGNNNEYIDISNLGLTSGVYFIRLEAPTGIVNYKGIWIVR